MKEYQQCRKCYKKPGPKDMPGFFYNYVNKNGIEYKTVEECECHKKYQIEINAFKTFKKNGFRYDLWDYDIQDYKGNQSIDNISRLKKYLKLIDNQKIKSSTQYWWGINGVSKTQTAHWLGKELIKKGIDTFYITMNDLVDMCWKSTRDNEIYSDIEYLLKVNILIIDESFDKTKVYIWKSGAQLGVIDNFIRSRLSNPNTGNIFISNVKIEDINKNGFSVSIQDLIYRDTKIQNTVFEWKDKYVDLIGDIPTEGLF